MNPNSYCFDYAAQLIQVTGVSNPLTCNASFSIIPDTNSNSVYVFNSSVGNNLTYFWDFGDGNSSTLQYPSYTYGSAGPFYLCLTVDDGDGCNSTYCDSIGVAGTIVKQTGFELNVTEPSTLGLNSNTVQNFVSLYPNPSTGLYTLEIQDLKDPMEFTVIDIRGKIIYTGIINSSSSLLDLTSVVPGMYVLQIEGESPIRLIKK